MLPHPIGTVSRLVTERLVGRTFIDDVATPVAAGLIVGEALVGVAFALHMVVKA